MSTSLDDLRGQEHDKIRTAVENDDYVTLYKMASDALGEGEEEFADHLEKLARQARTNDHDAAFGYDELRDNRD